MNYFWLKCSLKRCEGVNYYGLQSNKIGPVTHLRRNWSYRKFSKTARVNKDELAKATGDEFHIVFTREIQIYDCDNIDSGENIDSEDDIDTRKL
jgi:hypothetical protein